MGRNWRPCASSSSLHAPSAGNRCPTVHRRTESWRRRHFELAADRREAVAHVGDTCARTDLARPATVVANAEAQDRTGAGVKGHDHASRTHGVLARVLQCLEHAEVDGTLDVDAAALHGDRTNVN